MRMAVRTELSAMPAASRYSMCPSTKRMLLVLYPSCFLQYSSACRRAACKRHVHI